MKTITVSATKARNDFFSLLNALKLGSEFTIQKDNQSVGRLIPMASDIENWEIRKKRVLKTLNETRGALRGVNFKSPFRGKSANKWLGNWDLWT